MTTAAAYPILDPRNAELFKGDEVIGARALALAVLPGLASHFATRETEAGSLQAYRVADGKAPELWNGARLGRVSALAAERCLATVEAPSPGGPARRLAATRRALGGAAFQKKVAWSLRWLLRSMTDAEYAALIDARQANAAQTRSGAAWATPEARLARARAAGQEARGQVAALLLLSLPTWDAGTYSFAEVQAAVQKLALANSSHPRPAARMGRNTFYAVLEEVATRHPALRTVRHANARSLVISPTSEQK